MNFKLTSPGGKSKLPRGYPITTSDFSRRKSLPKLAAEMRDVHRPTANSVQAKIRMKPPAAYRPFASAQAKSARAAPPVYRPAAAVPSAQPKPSVRPPGPYRPSAAAQATSTKTAPPVYRPAPPVLCGQPKAPASPPAAYRPFATAQASSTKTVPPVNRPAPPAPSAQPKPSANPLAASRPFAAVQAKPMNTAPPVYRPAAPAPSGMVQAGPGHISSVEKTEQPGKARAVQPRSMSFLGGRPAGFQTSSAVQRAQALDDEVADEEEPKVHPAMVEAAGSARAFANNWNTQNPHSAAEECVNTAFQITSVAREKMEKKGAAWRAPGKKVLMIGLVEDVITAESASRRGAIAKLAADVIRHQVLTEANNRFSYILQVILSTKFEEELPAQGKMLKRQKTFKADEITKQFSEMYNLQ